MPLLYVPTTLTAAGPNGTSYVAGVVDADQHLAIAETPFYQTPSGILVPAPADANGVPLHTSRITTAITTAALGASGVYTQPWQDAQAAGVTYVAGSVLADQAGTLTINFSDDGVHVAKTTTLLTFTPTTAGTANAAAPDYPVQIPTRYYQCVYTNGSTAQGTFALYQTPLSDWSPRAVDVTGSLPAGSAQLGTVGLTGQGLPRYTFDQLLVNNATITVAAGAFYGSAFRDLSGLDWAASGFAGVSGTSLNYDVAIQSLAPLTYDAGGGPALSLMYQQNSGLTGSAGASNAGNGITGAAQAPTASTRAVLTNANTTDSLTFTYCEIVGG